VLLQAIKDRDLPRFEKCMYDHLHYNISFLIKTIKGEYRDYLINY
jgi:DNA-binding GntR family transcriptional regulator